MIDLANAAHLAVRSTRHTALSARPDAPVVVTPDRVRRGIRVRAHLATALHRVAAALEPRESHVNVRTTAACR